MANSSVHLLLAFASIPCACASFAQSYPQKPIRLIVAQAPGSTTDFLGRVLATKVSGSIGQQIVVEPRPGAGGALGADAVAKAAPDGYTILLGNISTHGVNPSLYTKLPYDAVADFAPVSMTAITENVLVAHPSLPVRTARDLISLAKKNPGELTISSAGNGSAQHLAIELFKGISRISILHVPYKGGNPAITAVISGETSLMIPTLPLALPHIKARKIRIIAVASAQRLRDFPTVPTVAETIPGYEFVSWFGLLGPAATPRDVIRKLNDATVSALGSTEVQNQLVARGLEPRSSSPEEFGAFIKAEIAKWTRVARASNIRAD